MMRKSVRSGIAATTTAAALAIACSAAYDIQAQSQGPSRAEQLIKYRQALYTVIGGNFGPIAAMVTGKAPFDAQELTARAGRVAFVAQMLDEAYPAESQKGAPTRAKAEIWSDRARFDELLDDMQAKTSELARVSQTGDEAEIRPVVGAVGEACKACHDRFREKQ